MQLYTGLLRPLLFRMEAESAHHCALRALALGARCPALLRMLFGARPPAAPVSLFGLNFPNPVGLAAGMDKNAVALRAWEALGFGFVEAGTITAKPQSGNPRPRMFRYPEVSALINRMGFNNDGAEAVAERLEKSFAKGGKPGIPVGLNLGKSKVTPLENAPSDYLASYRRLHALGDYFVVNVSSPNTPGLRRLQDAEALRAILETLRDWEGERKKPLLVKLAPDLEPPQITEAVEIGERCGADGFIATNTTLDHSSVPDSRDEQGGLSGAPLAAKATAVLKTVRAATKLPLIASGGVVDTTSAMEKFTAGAELVQIYTGFVYQGPALIRSIAKAR